MKTQILFIALIFSISNCDFPLPDAWREAKDPLELKHYREILSNYFSQYFVISHENDEVEGTKDERQTISRHITEGIIANFGQFDHHVLMFMYKSSFTFICGASLIKYNWAITAAHCIYDMDLFLLYFGIINRKSSAQWLEKINNKSHVKMHPYYDDDTLQNDIAMMFMASATEQLLTLPHVAVVRLPTYENLNVNLTARDGTVCGFGKTSDTSESSSLLRYIIRPIISNKACGKVFDIFPTNLCIDTSGGKSTCEGDSGGGLTTEIDSCGKVLVGIVSFGAFAGCTLGYPTGFTAVLSYLDWIDAVQTLDENEFTEDETNDLMSSTTIATAISVNAKILFVFFSQIFVILEKIA